MNKLYEKRAFNQGLSNPSNLAPITDLEKEQATEKLREMINDTWGEVGNYRLREVKADDEDEEQT